MFRKVSASGWLLLVAAGLAGACKGEPPVREVIEANYAAQKAAAQKNDLAGYMQWFAPDFVAVRYGTQMDRQQTEEHMRGELGGVRKWYSYDLVIREFSVNGDQVDVQLTNSMKTDFADEEGEFGPRGEVRQFDGAMTGSEQWKKTPTGWLITRSETTLAKGTIDGRPFEFPPPSRTELQMLYEAKAAALQKKDIAGFVSVLSPEYTATQSGRTMNRKQFEEHAKGEMATVKTTYLYKPEIKRALEFDNRAQVELELHLKMDVLDPSGEFGPKNGVHQFEGILPLHDQWQKTERGWTLVHTDALPFKGTLDGKPFEPGKP